MDSLKVVIAIDLGGTKCAGAAVNASGEILFEVKDKLTGKKGKEVGALIRNQIMHLQSICMDNGYVIIGVGVSVPGISNKKTDTVWAPNIPGWERYPLKKELTSVFEDKDTLIEIESDRACTILGEVWLGSAQDCSNVILLAIGTGIGAGILIDGKVLHGSEGIGGAIGWWGLSDSYHPDYIQFGDFEYHASGDGIIRVTRDFMVDIKSDLINHETIKDLTAKEIFEYYDKKDPIAILSIELAIRYWGRAVANLVSIFNPEKIIFGGGVFGPGVRYLNEIYEEAKKWAQPIAIQQVKLVGAELGNNAAILGACKLILDQTNRK